jgi:hypothetical protein
MNKAEMIWTIVGLGAFVVLWFITMYFVTKPKKNRVAKETIIPPVTIPINSSKPVVKVTRPKGRVIKKFFIDIFVFLGACLYWLYKNFIVRPIKAIGKLFSWIYRKPIVGTVTGIAKSPKGFARFFVWIYKHILVPPFRGLWKLCAWIYKIGSRFFGFLASIVGTIIIIGLMFGIPYLVYRYDSFWGIVVATVTGLTFILYKFGKMMGSSLSTTTLATWYKNKVTKLKTKKISKGNIRDIITGSTICIIGLVCYETNTFSISIITWVLAIKTVVLFALLAILAWAIYSIYIGKPILKMAIVGLSSILAFILVYNLWPFGFGDSKKPMLSEAKTEVKKPVTPQPQPIAQIVDRVVDTSIVAPVGIWNTFDIPDRDGNMSSDIFSQDSLMVLLPNGVIWYGLKVNNHISFYLDNKGLTHIPAGRVERGHMKYSVQSFASKQKDYVHIRYGPTKLFAQK